MLEAVRARLRRRRGRFAVVCAVAVLGATVASAHSSVAADHMGDAAVMCLAVAATGAAAAALPAAIRAVTHPQVSLCIDGPATPPTRKQPGAYRARGDPALLQVFRR